MGIFNPPVGNKSILNIEGVSGNTFEVNAEGTNPYTRVELFAKNDWPNTDEEESTLMVESYKDLGSGNSTDAYFYTRAFIDETDGDPSVYMLLQTGDTDNNWFYHEFDLEVDKIYYWMEGLNPYIRVDNTNEYIKIFPTSIVFNDGINNVAEFATTGITIGTGRCPIYWGELASAPATFSNGDEYYNTGDSKFYKYNGNSWIALN